MKGSAINHHEVNAGVIGFDGTVVDTLYVYIHIYIYKLCLSHIWLTWVYMPYISDKPYIHIRCHGQK